jgi:hypothetical protein
MPALTAQPNTHKEIFLRFIDYTVFRGYYSSHKDARIYEEKGPNMNQNRTIIIQNT